MAGKVYDRQTLVVDRDPLKQLAVEVGKFPKIDPVKALAQATQFVEDYLLDAFKDVTGIDLKSAQALLDMLPGFDASKIISGILSGSLIPGLDASKIVSGVFPMERVAGLLEALASGDVAGIVEALTGIVGGGLPDLANWSSLVPKLTGGLLSGSIIPGLDASKIVSGLLGAGFIPQLDAGKIGSGTFGSSLIPALDASKITSGLFPQSMITGLPAALASFLTNSSPLNAANLTGLLASMIPQLDASKIGSGAFPQSMITGLPAAIAAALTSSSPLDATKLVGSVATSLLSGALGAGLIPQLDASKIGSGTFADALIPGLGSTRDAIVQALGGGAATGTTPAQVKSALQAIPGGNLVGSIASSLLSGTLGAAQIPSLDASKIGSGTFPQSMLSITSIAAGIVSGTLGAAQIPTLDASKINTGVFGAGLIPSLDASKIGSGTLLASLIPTLPASILSGGTLAASLIPSIDASKIGSGVLGLAQLPTSILTTGSPIPAGSLTGTITEAVTGVGSLRDAFLNGLFGGVAGSGYSNADAQQQAATVAQQAASAQAAAAAANAQLAAQAAQQNSNNSAGGIYRNIQPAGANGAALSGADFAATGPTAGDLQIRGNAGYIGIRASAPTNTVGYYAILAGLFATDNQSLEVALGDQGAYDAANTTLYLHCDTAHTVGAYCQISNDQIVIGSYTRSGSAYAYTPFAGGTYNGTIQSGMRVGYRNVGTTWSILVGGNAVLNVVNGSVAFSAARRTAAISMDRQHSSGFFGWGSAEYDAFRVASISMADYVIPTYIGSGARMSRAITTALAPTSRAAGSFLLPNNTFTVVQESTADITVDTVTGRFTVANAGWYHVRMRTHSGGKISTNGGGSFGYLTPLLYRNGSIAKWGQPMWSALDANGSLIVGSNALHSDFDIYLAAGDYVQAGHNNSAAMATAWTIVGDASNVQTYFEIALLNRSTL